MPPSKDGTIDMAPPSVLGSDARSASLANMGCGFSDRDVSGAGGREGDGRNRRCGCSLLADRRHRLGGRRLALRGARSNAWTERGAPRARSRNSARSRGQIGRGGTAQRGDGCAGTCAVEASTAKTGAEGRLAPGPARPRRDPRVGDRGDPGWIWRLALRRRRVQGRHQAATPPPDPLGPTLTARDPGSSGMTILARA